MTFSKIFCCYKSRGLFWFRIFGYGLIFKNYKKRGLIFSERNKMTKFIIIGKYLIRPLKR